MKALKLLSICAVVVIGVIATGFLVFVSSLDDSEPGALARADAIVVLTGGADRIQRGLELLETGHARRMLISGVHRQTTPRALARLIPGSERWFKCCIDVGYAARDTFGNATEARDWAVENGFNTLIVVTSNYHMPRSITELSLALPETQLTPFPVSPPNLQLDKWWHHARTREVLALEYLKLLPVKARYTWSRLGGAARGDAAADQRADEVLIRPAGAAL